MTAQTDELEQKLLGEEAPKAKPKRKVNTEAFSDEPSRELSELERHLMFGQDDIFINDNGMLDKAEAVVKTLNGAEAMKFLGLPPRDHNMLMRDAASPKEKNDFVRIHRKFKPLIEEYISEGKSPKKLFWDNIKIRVWKVENVGRMTGTGTNSHVEATKYAGDVYTGAALQVFLSPVLSSRRPHQYRVQLLEVKVTEDMDRV